MKINRKSNNLLFNKDFLVITLLALGGAFIFSSVTQRTETQQHASQQINLNSANDIETTNNPDGTMGASSSASNFSASLPSAYLGNFSLNLKDYGNFTGVSSLSLTFSKAEAHLVYLYLPGTNPTNEPKVEKINVNGAKTNQNINKWENVLLTPVTIELKNGQTLPLTNLELASGKYSEIRLYVSKASVKLIDGKEVEMNISPKNRIIRLNRPFSIYSGDTKLITISLDKQNSIINTGNNYFLQTVINQITVSP